MDTTAFPSYLANISDEEFYSSHLFRIAHKGYILNEIALPYVLISIFALFLWLKKGDKRLFYSNGLVMGIITLVITVIGLYEILIAWYAGYIYEEIALHQRAWGEFLYARYGLLIFTILLGLLHLNRSVRSYSIVYFLLIMAYCVHIAFDPLPFLGSLTPGWHSSVRSTSRFVSFFPFLISLNLLVLYFKLIPELEEE